MQALSIRVSGKVQGVFFRASTKEKATELGLSSWCRNEPDGCVLIHAEGNADSLESLLAWCHEGPRWANVTKVEKEAVNSEGLNGFGIKR